MALRSFHRARRYFPPPLEWRIGLYLGGVVAALAVVAGLLLLALVAELLVSRGVVQEAGGPPGALARWAGADAPAAGGTIVNSGMLSLAWRWRDSAVGPPLQQLYRRVPALRTNVGYLTILALLLIVAAALQAAGAGLLHAARVHAVEDAAARVRTAIYRQALLLGGSEPLDGRGPPLAELFEERVDQLREGLAAWWNDLPGPLALLGLLLLVGFLIHPWLAVVAVLLGVPLGWLIYYRQTRAIERHRVYADRAARQMGLLVDRLSQVRLVRSYLLREAPGESFAALLDRYRKAILAAGGPLWGTRAGSRLLVFAAAVALLFLTSMNVLRDPPDITVVQAGLLAAALYSAQAPLRRLLSAPPRLRRAEAAARAIFAWLDREPKVGQLPDAVELPRLSNAIELRDVTVLDTSGRARLEGVSLRLKAGSRLAIVSTDRALTGLLAALLTRFVDPASGRVVFDDRDLRQATFDSLRAQIAVVLPERLLFTGTVAENIRCGDDRFSDLEVAEAAKRTSAYEFVQGLPEGFATVVGEHGIRLDPSEAFRVALARAVLRDPALLILEEPPAPPREEDAQLLHEAVQRSAVGRAVVIVPCSLRTLRTADHVALIHEGKLVASGAHAELLQTNELYRHLNYVRFSELRSLQ